MQAGIEVRHLGRCRTLAGGRTCDCVPTYRASVWDNVSRRKIKRTFKTRREAERWRREAQNAVLDGSLTATPTLTVKEAFEAWIADAEAGVERNRSGDPYKPSALRTYRQAMRLHVEPAIGTMPFGKVTRADVQKLVDDLVRSGYAPATVGASITALRAVYRSAIDRGQPVDNPCARVKVPRIERRRERFATPAEATALLAALKDEDRPIWATALYAGLRRGELMALRWMDVDLDAGLLHVRRGWDLEHGPIEPKYRASKRTVPLAAILRPFLAAQKLRTGRDGDALVFGRTAHIPFDYSSLPTRAQKAWQAAGLERISLHECRHTFASLMIAAGVNAKALSTYMGHASVDVTFDVYGHLMPGSEAEAARLLDAYLSARTG